MSKRKHRSKSPNLPEAALARARAQVNKAEAEETTEEAVAEEVQQAAKVEQAAVNDEPAAPRARTRSKKSMSNRERTRRHAARMLDERDSKRHQLDSDLVRQMLANPTKYVTEEELSQQYAYVIQDLRSMWTLAFALFIVLIIANVLFL